MIPTDELITAWRQQWHRDNRRVPFLDYMLSRTAEWMLNECVEWLTLDFHPALAERLLEAFRPTPPPTLREQALAMLPDLALTKEQSELLTKALTGPTTTTTTEAP